MAGISIQGGRTAVSQLIKMRVRRAKRFLDSVLDAAQQGAPPR
ncbi:hypothetical protein [Variovorax paradoxus]|nr:hypothetical protein [Variovorax paradoxus]